MDRQGPWAELNVDEKLETRFQIFNNPNLPFVSPEAEAGYKARAARLTDAFLLRKTPDRVPVTTLNQFYPANHVGFTPYDVMYDQEKAAEAWLGYAQSMEPDAMVGPAIAAAAPARSLTLSTSNSSVGPAGECRRRPASNISRKSGCS